MPGQIGYVGDEAHDKLIRDLDELQQHFLMALRPRFQEMVQDHRLYLGHREDRRKAHEKWRSWSWLGDPSRLTETEVQSWMEIMSSLDPPVQAEGRSTEDEWKARGFERYASYFLRANRWPYTQEMVLRGLSIQGWKVIKTGWKEITYSPMRRPSKEQMIEFDRRLNEALKSGVVSSPPDPGDTANFQAWVDQTQQVVPGFPDSPQPAPSEVVEYRGPWLFRPSEFELRFDPFIEDWSEHQVIFQRVVKPRSWGEKQVELGKFDERQFREAARRGPEDKRLSEWDQEIAEEIGLTWDQSDPVYQNSDEYFEIWRPQNETAPYLVMLNRSGFVNASTENPFWHRQSPYLCIRNTPLERRAFGLGSYHQLRRTFHDRLTFRDLLLDGLLLSVMPVFLKSRNLGMPELQRFLSPGAILDVNDPNGLKRGWESMAGFAELMKVGELLLSDQNTQLGTWENVQGQSATVGRVSATESESRLQQALIKHKRKAERMEEEESRIWPQVFYNAYQFYPQSDPELAELRRQIVGEDEQDPLGSPEFTPDTFAEDLAKTVRFRGATTRLQKDLNAQQLKDFLMTYSQIMSATPIPVPILAPQELRAIARRAYEITGQKGVPQVFTAEGDEAVLQASQANMLQAQTAPLAAQAQLLQLQMQMQQLLGVDPVTGQPLPPGGGNGEALPEEVPPEGGPPPEGPVG
jgi:hypothetical protein